MLCCVTSQPQPLLAYEDMSVNLMHQQEQQLRKGHGDDDPYLYSHQPVSDDVNTSSYNQYGST